MARKDPTRTATKRRRLRSIYNRKIGKVYNEAKRVARTGYFIGDKIEELQEGVFDENLYRFLPDAERMAIFNEWIDKEVDRVVIERQGESPLVRNLQDVIDQKARNTIQNLRGFGLTIEEVIVTRETIRASQVLFARAFESMKGLGNEIKKDMAELLSRAILEGKSINEITEELQERLAIARARSQRIARTEIIRANNYSNIETADIVGRHTDSEMVYLWQTGRDELVRETHRVRDGRLYTKNAVLSLIGEPNCRCNVSPVPKEFSDEVQKRYLND